MPSDGDLVSEALRREIDRVRHRAGPCGQHLVYFTRVGSTNDVAADLARADAPDGTLVVAHSQTHGRGRHGRAWFSPPGAGLYFSLLLRPAAGTPAAVSVVTLAAGVAVAEAIERVCGLAPHIKWPNDLVVVSGLAPASEAPPHTAQKRRVGPRSQLLLQSSRCRPLEMSGALGWRKLAGVLAEATIVGEVVQHVVLGVGVNLRDDAYPEDLAPRVTSLAREMGHEVDGFAILAECVAAFSERWRQIHAGDQPLVLAEWRRRSPSAVGARVLVSHRGTTMLGETAGLHEDGSLVVDVAGDLVSLVAGEVQWL